MANTNLTKEEIEQANSFSINGSKYALTTEDNPYDPFNHFGDWFMYDVQQGYNSCAYLARIAHTSDSMSDSEIDEEIERAIDEIIKYDFLGIYKKVKNPNYY